MGKLVPFEHRGKDRPADKPEGSAKAEILIFTGVRYERSTDLTPPKPTASSGTKRKRG